MAIFMNGHKLTNLMYKGHKISTLWYKGKKIYSAYYPNGFVIANVNKPIGQTNDGGFSTFTSQGFVESPSKFLAQSFITNNKFPFSLGKIKTGIAVSFIQYYNLADSGEVFDSGNPSILNLKSPATTKITKPQIASGKSFVLLPGSTQSNMGMGFNTIYGQYDGSNLVITNQLGEASTFAASTAVGTASSGGYYVMDWVIVGSITAY